MDRKKKVGKDRKLSKPVLGAGSLASVLGFTLVFPVVARLMGIEASTVCAVFAALPGMLLAAAARRR